MKIAILIPFMSQAYKLSEIYLFNHLVDKKFEVDLLLFKKDKSITPLLRNKKRAKIIKTNPIFFFHKSYINKTLSNYDLIISRPYVGYKAEKIRKIIKEKSIKTVIYSINSVGGSFGPYTPDIYISPGNHWTKLINDRTNFLTGLKSNNYPFKTKNSSKIPKTVFTFGSLSTLEMDIKYKNLNKLKTNADALLFCLDSSPKYINEKGKPRSYLDFTLRVLNELKKQTNFRIYLKPHPFQVSKPYNSYKRKQLDLSIFEKLVDGVVTSLNPKLLSRCKYAIVNNSSIVYELAYLKKTCLVVANKKSDLITKDQIFSGGFLTPEIPGKIVIGTDELIKTVKSDYKYNNFKKYINNYHMRFDLKSFSLILKKLLSGKSA